MQDVEVVGVACVMRGRSAAGDYLEWDVIDGESLFSLSVQHCAISFCGLYSQRSCRETCCKPGLCPLSGLGTGHRSQVSLLVQGALALWLCFVVQEHCINVTLSLLLSGLSGAPAWHW
jgi:hypothetical protein